jgi:hypothetical protein
MYKAHNCRLNHSFRIFLKGSSSKKKGTKRTEFSDNVKKHLQDWFNKNKSHPYASKFDLKQLSKETGLSEIQISDWVNNMRKRKIEFKIPRQEYFTIQDKQIMLQFFDEISNRPGPSDLDQLSRAISKDTRKIRSFFNSERFKRKHF